MGATLAGSPLDAEYIKAEVARFWDALTEKSSEALEEFYAPESSVFSTTAIRPEPGRLAATRREREYFHPRTSLRVTLGPVEVVTFGNAAAVASYTFQLHATKQEPLSGKMVEEEVNHGRATQVFGFDPDGELRILHEHLSVPTQ